MDERIMNRRGVLTGAGAVGAVALAGVAGASPAVASEKDNRGVAGSWMITHQDDPPGDPTPRRSAKILGEPDSSSESPWNQATFASIRSARMARSDGTRISQG